MIICGALYPKMHKHVATYKGATVEFESQGKMKDRTGRTVLWMDAGSALVRAGIEYDDIWDIRVDGKEPRVWA